MNQICNKAIFTGCLPINIAIYIRYEASKKQTQWQHHMHMLIWVI